jgi:hypothetical protein
MKNRDEEELEKIISRAIVVAVVFYVIGIIGLLYVTFH